MSQTISPIDWLRTALNWFFISDIVENTASNASGRLCTCELSFFDPCVGFKSSKPYPRDGNTEPGRDKRPIKCRSHLFRGTSTYLLWCAWFLALQGTCFECWWYPRPTSKRMVCELQPCGSGKMVTLYLSHGYLLFIIVITFSNFFSFSPHVDCAPGPYLCYMWLVGHSRPRYKATQVRLGLLQW